jgi:hypothetical protein
LARVVAATALLGLSVGLGACGDPPYYDSEAFFANTTRQSVNVRLLELDATVDCAALDGHACERLTASAFVPEKMYTVGPGQALPLVYEESWRNGGTGATGGIGGGSGGNTQSSGDCGAAVVQIVGLPSTCVFWQNEGSASSEQLASVGDAKFRRRAIRLEGTTGLYRLATGAGLESGPLLPPATSEPKRLLGFSGRAAAVNNIVESVTELPDGCLAVGHRTAVTIGTTRSTIYLCVPRWAFPFPVGSEIAITTSGDQLTIRELDTLRRLELLLNAERQLVPLEGGHATRCGAYVEHFGLETSTGVLASGDMTDRTSAGIRTRLLLGRAERVVVALAACEPERARLGSRVDLLTVHSLETDP